MIRVCMSQYLMMSFLQLEKCPHILQRKFQSNCNMKKIVLKVTVEVPDDYVLDDPSWLLENIGIGYDYDVECI